MSWQPNRERAGATRQGHRRALILAFTIIGLNQAGAAQTTFPAARPHTMKITLRTYNYGISRGLLVKAEGEATEILNRAGIDVGWVECPVAAGDAIERYAACRAPMGTADFAVKILTSRQAGQVASYGEAMGQALECAPDQTGCSAYIFYRDVVELAREGNAAEYQLLGHALAHEIGHLLLGPNSHSASGIMRGHWNEQDLRTIARAYLLFTDQQSKQIQDEVSERNTIRQDQVASTRRP